MTVQIRNHTAKFNKTHHAIHWLGMTVIRPDGTQSYGEYRNIEEALNKVKSIAKREKE